MKWSFYSVLHDQHIYEISHFILPLWGLLIKKYKKKTLKYVNVFYLQLQTKWLLSALLFLFLNEVFTWFITLNLADLLLCIFIKISSGFQGRFKKFKAAIFKEAASA